MRHARADLHFWKGPGEYARGGDLDVCPAPGQRALRIQGCIQNPGKSLDLRAKYSRWLAEFERRGGTVVVRGVDVDALEVLAAGHDLVVVTTGRDSFTRLFERSAERSVRTQPQRNPWGPRRRCHPWLTRSSTTSESHSASGHGLPVPTKPMRASSRRPPRSGCKSLSFPPGRSFNPGPGG